jgi:electron transport complex protein RnfG
MTGVWAMYRALVGAGVLCGLLIVGVHELTMPIIERNRQEALEAAIFEVLPGARTTEQLAWTGSGFERSSGRPEDRVFAGYDADGQLVGLAIEAQGMGYQDTIKLLYGFDPRDLAIIGLIVLESRETPGLGDKIASDPGFQANFEHLEVKDEWHIDTISGATISSSAVASALKKASDQWTPRIEEARFEQ